MIWSTHGVDVTPTRRTSKTTCECYDRPTGFGFTPTRRISLDHIDILGGRQGRGPVASFLFPSAHKVQMIVLATATANISLLPL